MSGDIEDKLKDLPEDAKSQILDYIEFLSKKYSQRKKTKKNFTFNWEGGLSDLKQKYTSVELQHKASCLAVFKRKQ